MKTCTKCKQDYPATNDYFCRDSTKSDFLHSHCKVCSKKNKVEYHAKISPILKSNRKEIRDLYLISDEYKCEIEQSKIKEKERRKRWVQKNKEKIHSYAKIYNSTKRVISPEKRKEYRLRAYLKMMSCPYKKAIHYYRVRINDVLNGRNIFKANDIILFTREEFVSHIESLFDEGMNWSNHGEWHIDHIKPIASFDLTDKIQLISCWSLSNLQPLWSRDNLVKGKK
jgi:hypothetical protein